MKKIFGYALMGCMILCSLQLVQAETDVNLPKVEEQPQTQTTSTSESVDQKTAAGNVVKNTQDLQEAITNQADFVYTYVPNQIYKVYCTETRITDIQLQPGEEILYIGGADTVRWTIDKDMSGNGTTKQWHIFVKPPKNDLTTNFVITTDRHIYHLEVYAKTWCTPIINWAYPQEEKLTIMRRQELANESIPLGEDNMQLENMNFNYQISGRDYPWKPKLVFDDGSKVYLQMPATMKSHEAPALFVKDGRDVLLVNYRVRNGYYIVDRLFDEAEMRNGKEIIKIKAVKH